MLNLMKFPKALYLYEIEEAEQVLRMYMEHLDKRGSLVIGVDTETTGLDLIKDRPIVYSLYAPVRMHCPDVEMYGETYRLAGWEDTLKVFEPLLTDTRVTKVGSRISAYDWFMINHAEVDMQEPVHDTINMDWLVDENKQHGLKECCRDYLGWRMTAFKSVTGSLDVRTWPFGENAGVRHTGCVYLLEDIRHFARTSEEHQLRVESYGLGVLPGDPRPLSESSQGYDDGRGTCGQGEVDSTQRSYRQNHPGITDLVQQ